MGVKTIKIEPDTVAIKAAMTGLAQAFRGAWKPTANRGWPFGFQLLPRQRRCQLCAEAYTEDSPPPGCGYSDQPPICVDCKQVIDRVAENLSGQFGAPISTEAAVGLIGRRITYEQFQYGRHWQEHVPSHSRRLIGGD